MKRIFTIFMTMVMLLGMTQVAMAAEKNPDAFQAAVDVLKSDQKVEETEALPKVDPTEYIPVLMYHHFAVRDMGFGDGITTMQSELEEQIRYFKEQGYTIISMEELDQCTDDLLDAVLTLAKNREKRAREFDREAHHTLAKKAARESIVMLKNE